MYMVVLTIQQRMLNNNNAMHRDIIIIFLRKIYAVFAITALYRASALRGTDPIMHTQD